MKHPDGSETIGFEEILGITYTGCGAIVLLVVAVLAFALGRVTA